jgi:hypothetical protein
MTALVAGPSSSLWHEKTQIFGRLASDLAMASAG